MEIIFKNAEIINLLEFLDNMELSGKASIGRTMIKKETLKVNDSIAKDQEVIINEYDGWTDKDKGLYTQDDPDLNHTMATMLMEEVKIIVDNPFIKDFKKAFKEYDGELSHGQADVYAKLYETLGKEDK